MWKIALNYVFPVEQEEKRSSWFISLWQSRVFCIEGGIIFRFRALHQVLQRRCRGALCRQFESEVSGPRRLSLSLYAVWWWIAELDESFTVLWRNRGQSCLFPLVFIYAVSCLTRPFCGRVSVACESSSMFYAATLPVTLMNYSYYQGTSNWWSLLFKKNVFCDVCWN